MKTKNEHWLEKSNFKYQTFSRWPNLKWENERVLFPITVDTENLIKIVSAKTSAGYLLGYDDPIYIEQLEKIKLPFYLLENTEHYTVIYP